MWGESGGTGSLAAGMPRGPRLADTSRSARGWTYNLAEACLSAYGNAFLSKNGFFPEFVALSIHTVDTNPTVAGSLCSENGVEVALGTIRR